MSLFGDLMERHERERHASILWGRFSRRWPSLSGDELDATFLPSGEAAAVMGVDEEVLLEMALNGMLRSRHDGHDLLVQPAIVSTVAVKDGS